ncbi:MAG: hypothetical protein JJE22_12755 [Bacteroidia bacterium]|nr:hypothetical protein [Bacteroidia bacterium]
MSKLSFPFFLCLIVAFLLVSCKSFKEPEFTGIENVRLGEIGLDGSTLKLDLHYFNHNKSKLQMKYAEGDAWMGENRLGHFIVDTLIHVPANADFFLPVTLKVDMAFVFRNALSAFINNEVLIKIEGKAKIGRGGLFIQYPIHYQGKQNISKLLKLP